MQLRSTSAAITRSQRAGAPLESTLTREETNNPRQIGQHWATSREQSVNPSTSVYTAEKIWWSTRAGRPGRNGCPCSGR